jgi:DsbC/DsbD-like thiol-disulfide interchange protein
MIATSRMAHLLTILAATSLLGAASSAAIAADASRWDDDLQSSARLIAAQARSDSGGRVFRAGVEIKLKQGWHTYWRYPGDSGVPPVPDFSKSQNVKTVTVLYPAPARFPDGAGGNSIGYNHDVVLPLHVVPQDASKPVTLNLKLGYAVCEKLCVPAEANLQLPLTGMETANDAAVSAAEAQGAKACGHRRWRHAGDPCRASGAGPGQAARRRGRSGGSRCSGGAVRGGANRAVGIALAGAGVRCARGRATL